MTEVTNPFIALARCSVEYEGRASSTLETGVYLLIRKADGAFLVHGSDLVTPLNYQPAGSKTYQDEWKIVVKGKKESLTVIVYEMIHVHRPKEWSDTKITIVRTEKDLQQELYDNLPSYITGHHFAQIYREFPTPHGPIDLVAVDHTRLHVIEVKRDAATVSAGVQLRKYLDALEEMFPDAPQLPQGYIAAPRLAANASRYYERRGYIYVPVQHRPTGVVRP